MRHKNRAEFGLRWVGLKLVVLASLVACSFGLASEQASATSHAAPFTQILQNCKTEESGSVLGLHGFRHAYVCDVISSSGFSIITTQVCIPFSPGANDFGSPPTTRPAPPPPSTAGPESRYTVVVYGAGQAVTFMTVGGTEITCKNMEAFALFAVVCDFILDPNRPASDKPLNVDQLSRCSLESFSPDPPGVSAGGRISYNLKDCETTLGTNEFYKCLYDSASPNNGSSSGSVCVSFDSGGVWDLDSRQGQTHRYLVDIHSDGTGCNDLRAAISNTESSVDQDSVAFFVTCGFNFVSNGRKHPVRDDGLNHCKLSANWNNLPAEALPAGASFENVIDCDPDPNDKVHPINNKDDPNCGFLGTVNSFLSWMAYLVVPIVTIVIIIGAIQLSIAGDNPEGTKKAKTRITQAVVALIFYILIWSILRWLI